MKKLILILLLIPEVSALIVTEFMPNPEGPDEDLEWIELYNSYNNSMNLQDFYLNGKILPNLQVNPKETVVLVRQLLDKDNDSFSFEKQYGNQDNIWNENFTAIESSFSLSNTNGAINLTNLTYTELIHYDTSTEGFSFVKESLNGSFTISVIKNGEPGKFNILSIEKNLTENNSTNETQQINQSIKLEIIEFMPNPKGVDNDKPPNGEWIKIKNLGDPLNLENFYLEDNSNGKLFITSSNIDGNIFLNTNEILKVYRNTLEDFSLNNNADTIKLKYNNTLFDSVSYTSSLEGISWKKINNSWISEEEKEFQEEKETENYIKIEKVYGKINFDNTLYIKLNIYYKEELDDNDVVLYIENITDKIKLQLYSENINYSLLLPLKIKSNCDNEFNEGNYFIIASGISTYDKKRIFVESNEKCDLGLSGINLKESKSIIVTETTITKPIEELKNPVLKEKENVINTKETLYTSKESQIQSYALILFVALLILITGALIYGRWENTHKDNIGSSWGSERTRRKNYGYDFGEYKK